MKPPVVLKKLTIRIPLTVHTDLKKAAAERRTTMGELILEAIRKVTYPAQQKRG